MNSRFITYPSIVDKSENHTVILIDATEGEISKLKRFLQISIQDFDVYLYNGQTSDLEWLHHISINSDHTLINDASCVQVTSAQRYQKNVLDYFEQIEQQMVDNATN